MRFALILIASVLLGACTSMGAGLATPDIPPNAVESTHTEANGDVVSEYRVSGQLRVVRVQPVRGAAYYLMDRNGDGRPESTRSDVSPVYYKLFSW